METHTFTMTDLTWEERNLIAHSRGWKHDGSTCGLCTVQRALAKKLTTFVAGSGEI